MDWVTVYAQKYCGALVIQQTLQEHDEPVGIRNMSRFFLKISMCFKVASSPLSVPAGPVGGVAAFPLPTVVA